AIASEWPVARSKAGASSSSAALTPFEARTSIAVPISVLVQVSQIDCADLGVVGLGRPRPAVRLPGLHRGERQVMGAGELQRVAQPDHDAEAARVIGGL